ncbi:MAG TPA: choice-of-anchor P family protein [Acidimicrobiales bacterium]|nr:choice-of-anchor P family protein [Acidimicrobiales bacterium]
MKHFRSLRRFIAILAAVLLPAALFAGTPASADRRASDTAPSGHFSCRASVARVEPDGVIGFLPTIEPFVANKPNDPCVTEADQNLLNTVGKIIDHVALGVDVKIVYADTVNLPGKKAVAEAGVAKVRIVVLNALGLHTTIEVEVLTSEARALCIPNSNVPNLRGRSTVVGLRIDGLDVEVPRGERSINIPFVGTLYLNKTITGNNEVAQRALWLDTSIVGDVIVAESIADFGGTPCPGTIVKPPKRIHGWMTGGGKVAGSNVTHGARLECEELDGPNNLQVNWQGNGFHLLSVAGSGCAETALNQEKPDANFDTLTGNGEGRCQDGSVTTAKWTLTDGGEPGTADSFEITIPNPDLGNQSSSCAVHVSGLLDRGNHQAHGRI